MQAMENTLAQDMTLDDKVRSWLCRIIYIATSCLYLYTAGFGSLDEMVQRCLLIVKGLVRNTATPATRIRRQRCTISSMLPKPAV